MTINADILSVLCSTKFQTRYFQVGTCFVQPREPQPKRQDLRLHQKIHGIQEVAYSLCAENSLSPHLWFDDYRPYFILIAEPCNCFPHPNGLYSFLSFPFSSCDLSPSPFLLLSPFLPFSFCSCLPILAQFIRFCITHCGICKR